MKEVTISGLRRFNMIMGGLHFIQGVVMLILASTVIQTISEFTPTITVAKSMLAWLVLFGAMQP